MTPAGTGAISPRATVDPLAALSRAATGAPPIATAVAAVPPPAVWPQDPAKAGTPVVFGSQIFGGRFVSERSGGFNPDYRVAPGDRIALRMWGAFTLEQVQTVDAQGSVFIPNVGPVHVAGVRNAELNALIEAQAKRVFRSSVGVYASIEAAQPVKVFVTGFVRAPGLYGGLSGDSVLSYLDRAGGIDPDRGSFLDVTLLRNGQAHRRFNLYRFLLEGQIDPMPLQDGDTLVAAPRRHTVQVAGEVLNPYVFEFEPARLPAAQLIALARPRPGATHLSIVRKVGNDRRSEYHRLSDTEGLWIDDGDEVTFTADKATGTILVRLEGAHLGERTLVLPYGARLRDALARLRPAPQAAIESLQLFRKSVATRQKEMLETSLRNLETYALTARSATSEEATLRGKEAELLLQFIERARGVQPRGQVLLTQRAEAADTLLEDGDVIRVPERSNLVLVSGEVLFPNAIVWDPRASAADYVRQAGGPTSSGDDSRAVVLHQDGSVGDAAASTLRPGDELLVLPKVQAKNVEITRGVTQVIYQIAVAAKVLFGL